MKKFYLLIFCLLISLLLTGCISIKDNGQAVKGGALGVYKSVDGSKSWQEKNFLLNVQGKMLTIGDVSVNRIVMDPNDRQALYLATDKGLYYSYTGADSWQRVELFADAPINDVAVDYFDKCNIFVTAGQSIYKTTDCLRTWQEVYFDSRAGLSITEVETEYYNKNIVYAADNKGEVLKSTDYGKTWQTIKRLDNPVKQILIDKNDTRIVYVATETAGLFRTTDGGKTWSNDNPETDLNKELEKFYDGKVTHYLVQDMTEKNTFILASQYGLLRTTNGGLNWESIELITPERGANIFSLAIDPKNGNNLYYGTDTIIYKSADGGKSWATQKSPTSGAVNFLLINPEDSNIIYLGGKAIKK